YLNNSVYSEQAAKILKIKLDMFKKKSKYDDVTSRIDTGTVRGTCTSPTKRKQSVDNLEEEEEEDQRPTIKIIDESPSKLTPLMEQTKEDVILTESSNT